MKLTDPLRVVHVALPTRNVLRVPGVHEHNFETSRLEDLEDGDPVDACRLHRDRRDAHLREPVCESMEVSGEALEGTNRLVVSILRHGNDVERRTDVKPCRMPLNDSQRGR